MESLKMVLKSSGDWSRIEKANKLVSILASEDDFITPEIYDQYEPEKYSFDPSNLTNLHEFWTSKAPCVIFKRKNPYLNWINVTIARGKRFNEFLSSYDIRYFINEDKIQKLVSFAKQLYDWGNVDYGYICHQEDWEMKNKFLKPIIVNGKPLTTGGVWLRESLPGLYWMNIFGSIYVNFIGRNKFESLSAYEKEELSDGGYIVFASHSPLDFNKPETQKLQNEIINHLGYEIFFDKSNPTKKCRVPKEIKEYANKDK